MAWEYRILVVANITADSPELIEALKERANRDQCRFTLLLPGAPPGQVEEREAARERLENVLERLRAEGLKVEGMIGDHDSVAAVHDTWDPREYDEVVVSTLPTGSSRWLQVDLPHRVEKLTGAPVKHVVAQPPRPEPETKRRPKPESSGILSPLTALTGKGPRQGTGRPPRVRPRRRS